jgi:hypothetical protein
MQGRAGKHSSSIWLLQGAMILVPIVGPLAALAVSIVGRKHPWAKRLGLYSVLFFALHVFCLWALLSSSFFFVCTGSRESELVLNSRAIQLALERYATDNGGFYPIDIHELERQYYLPAFYKNPLSRHNHVLMEPVPLAAGARPGNVTYIPIELPTLAEGKATSYFLLTYGISQLKTKPPDPRIPLNTIYIGTSKEAADYQNQRAMRKLLGRLAEVLNSRTQ